MSCHILQLQMHSFATGAVQANNVHAVYCSRGKLQWAGTGFLKSASCHRGILSPSNTVGSVIFALLTYVPKAQTVLHARCLCAVWPKTV